MPFLSFKQIIEKINWLICQDLHSQPEWCREEWNVNLFMLSAAASDLVDDYLLRGVPDFSEIADYVPVLDKPLKIVRETSMLYSRIRGTLTDKKIRRWRRLWGEWLISVSESLVANRLPSPDDQSKIKNRLTPLLNIRFPESLITMRMRLPAAFRSQDLTHHDFILLSKKIVSKKYDKESPYLVIGLRTAGSYIAPLVCACLKSEGYKRVSFMTVRPKSFGHPLDKSELKKNMINNIHFILVDEPPYSGKSIALSVRILKSFGVEGGMITLLVPIHPAGRNWLDASLKHSLDKINIITLEPEEWYKEQLLRADKVRDSITPYFLKLGLDNIKVVEDEHSVKISEELMQNPDKAFHRRLKKVFKVIADDNSGLQSSFLLMAKSVGWGWLGYGAALSALQLSDFIPQVYGVRNGIMFMDFVKNGKESRDGKITGDDVIKILSGYIARRATKLRLEENPMPFLSGYQDSGLQAIAVILSKSFCPKVKTLKRGWIRKQLEQIPCPVPALLDSRMMKNEWINFDQGLLKTDFEQHGFSKTASHNIVDPAYDIAGSMVQFDLSDRERNELIKTYIGETGDASVISRLFYYKLLSGSEALKDSFTQMNMIEYSPLYPECNRKYISAWNFLVSETMHYSAALCEGQPVRRWSAPMFVMDVDDVLDKNIFGFPSTTADGIRSISMLRTHGICSIINTARSVDEVKDYCNHYGFAGGIAEYGSVIWDDLDKRADVLISPEALDELAILRNGLTTVPGVFMNPFYQYSIRVYSFDSQRTVPVPDALIGELFTKLGIRHLAAKRSYIDTAIYDKSVDKGKALLKLKELKGMKTATIGAVGDTESDLPMLIAADQGFLVGNSGINLKSKARKYGVSVVKSTYQSGLFEAVDIFLHGERREKCTHCKNALDKLGHKDDLFWYFLKIADMSKIQHWFRAFDRNILEIFRE